MKQKSIQRLCIFISIIICVLWGCKQPTTVKLKVFDGDHKMEFTKSDTSAIIMLLILQEQTIKKAVETDDDNIYNPKHDLEILRHNEKQYQKMYGEDWHETLEKALESAENEKRYQFI